MVLTSCEPQAAAFGSCFSTLSLVCWASTSSFSSEFEASLRAGAFDTFTITFLCATAHSTRDIEDSASLVIAWRGHGTYV
jgi:hypothetical protein